MTSITRVARPMLIFWLLASPATPAAADQLPQVASPDFTAPYLNDPERSLSLSALKGKVVLLNFWASWCYPCRYEMPLFQTLYERFREDGFEVVAVAVFDELKDARAFQAKYKFSFPLLFDAEEAAAQAFDIDNVPQTFLIGRDGLLIPVPNPNTKKRDFIVNDPTVWELPETAEFLNEVLKPQS